MVTKLFTLKKKYLLLTTVIIILNGCAIHSNSKLNEQKHENIDKNDSVKQKFKSMNIFNFPKNEFNNTSFEKFFENYTPQKVGDTLTVILQENMTASNNISNNFINKENTGIGINHGYEKKNNSPEKKNHLFEFNTAIKNDFIGRGGSFANNKIVGLITVTINKILPNGNLEVSGNKNIVINNGTEKIRFYGIVNPYTISKNNSVLSTEIANTDITYISEKNNKLKNINLFTWLKKIFLSLFSL